MIDSRIVNLLLKPGLYKCRRTLKTLRGAYAILDGPAGGSSVWGGAIFRSKNLGAVESLARCLSGITARGVTLEQFNYSFNNQICVSVCGNPREKLHLGTEPIPIHNGSSAEQWQLRPQIQTCLEIRSESQNKY
jgi:hypothetical protein